MNPVVSRKWAGFLLMTLVLGSFFSPYTLFFEKEIAQAEDAVPIPGLTGTVDLYTGTHSHGWPLLCTDVGGCPEIYGNMYDAFATAEAGIELDESLKTGKVEFTLSDITGDKVSLSGKLTLDGVPGLSDGIADGEEEFDDMIFAVWIKESAADDSTYDKISGLGEPKIDTLTDFQGGFEMIKSSLAPNTEYTIAFWGAYDLSLREIDATGGTTTTNGIDGGMYMHTMTFKTANEADDGVTDVGAAATFTTTDIGDLWWCLKWGKGLSLSGCYLTLYNNTVYPLSAAILALTGKFFDGLANWSLSSVMYQQSVTDADGTVTDTLVGTGWKLVRDFANIFFILILVYLSITIILGIENAHAKKSIATAVVVALLINFSLLFCQLVLDSSNILARVFYNQIKVTGTLDSGISATDLDEVGLSEALTEGFKVQNIIGDPKTMNSLQAGSSRFGTNAMLFLMFFMGTVVNLAAAWVFFTVGIQFALRIVQIWFSMIFAPFAFFSNTNHSLQHLKTFGWTSWLKNFLCWCFFAPLFLFFVFLIMQLIEADFLAIILDAEKLENDFFLRLTGILLQFVIIILMLWKSKDLAKEMGCEGAEAATKAIAGVATGAMVGAGAFALRQTVGRAGSVIQNSETLKAMQVRGGVMGSLAKGTRNVGGYGAKQSFDLRNTGYGKAALKATGVKTGTMMFNKDAGKGGVTGIIERKEHKKLKAYQAELKGVASRRSDKQTEEHYTKKQQAWDKKNKEPWKAYMAQAVEKNGGKPLPPKEIGALKKKYQEENGRPVVYTKTSDANDARKKEYLHQMAEKKLGGGKIEEAFPGSPGQNTALGNLKEIANIAQVWRAGSRASEIEAMEKLEKMSKKSGSYGGAISKNNAEIDELKKLNQKMEKMLEDDKKNNVPGAKESNNHLEWGLATYQTELQGIESAIRGGNLTTSQLMKANLRKNELGRFINKISGPNGLMNGGIERRQAQNENWKDRADKAEKLDDHGHKEEKHEEEHHEAPAADHGAGGGGGGGHAH
jgi:hypothetical protein